MGKLGRVLVAMSGGVDSSVTAVMLHEQGYDVVGITMKTWDFATTGGSAEARARGKEIGCCSLESMNDARAVAVRLGVPHFVVDIRDEFGDDVVSRFTTEYLSGRTPNPCVLCNTHIKWDALLRRADALDCEYIATGHYARLRHDETSDRWVISRGQDPVKDQSYVLWGVEQEHLSRTLLPLGAYRKPEIRELARDMDLAVHDKPDSYEICFIPDNDYRGFLKRQVSGLEESVSGGAFVWESTDEIVGEHEGYPFYTVGQRRGLGVALGEPVYVTRIDPGTNTVYLGPREALEERALLAREVVWGKVPGLVDETPVAAQIRSTDRGALALARQTGDASFEVVFEEPRHSLTPGQAAVIYDGDDVLAGGWIHTVAGRDPVAEEELFFALPTV